MSGRRLRLALVVLLCGIAMQLHPDSVVWGRSADTLPDASTVTLGPATEHWIDEHAGD